MTKTVLVVEDDKNIQELLRLAMYNEGYEVIIVNNGFEALAYLEKQQPDLLITDIMMPELDGIKLMKALQFREETKDIPLIIVSAKDSVPDILKGLESGARFYFTKPLKINELLAHIKFLLKMSA
ncbi:response regulator transcription factor [candidate division CSSED10-310 bacterium]|uniref:Response regulator transcription factor n=1 Tax=candidate division CSSED10-310 bacterium TaxID=2855610 RepID=A0ABV6Z1R6_UNCC1